MEEEQLSEIGKKLYYSSQKGDIKAVEKIAKKINLKDFDQSEAFIRNVTIGSLSKGKYSVIKKYVKEIIDPTYVLKKIIVNEENDAALEMVKFLIEKSGAKILEMEEEFIEQCVWEGNYDIMEYLISKGLKSNHEKVLENACIGINESTRMLMLLIKAGCNLKENNYKVVKLAMKKHKWKILGYLLERMKLEEMLEEVNYKEKLVELIEEMAREESDQ